MICLGKKLFRVGVREKMALGMLKHIKAPKDLTVRLAREALQKEAKFQGLSEMGKVRGLVIFDEEWGKVKGDVVSGRDVVDVPKRIRARLVSEGLIS